MALVTTSPVRLCCQVCLPQNAKCMQPRHETRPWCRPHSRMERCLHRFYKTFSHVLETWPHPEITFARINACDNFGVLQSWYDDSRKKLVLTSRVIQARRRHHELFYGGPDYGHGIFITQLSQDLTFLWEIMAALDDKAYSLYLVDQNAGWLSEQTPSKPSHTPTAQQSTPDEELYTFKVNSTQLVLSDASSEEEEGSDARNGNYPAIESGPHPIDPLDTPRLPQSDLSDDDDDDEDDYDAADIEELLKIKPPTEDGHICECCRHLELVEKPESTYQARLINYFTYADCYPESESEDREFAREFVSNVFRQVISRIPPLHLRAISSGCTDVKTFLESDALREHEHARLWRALKHKDGVEEGKVTPVLIRHALVDAEGKSRDSIRGKPAQFVEILGGRVWKTEYDGPMSFLSWDHFYNIIYCNCCADAIMRDFYEWVLVHAAAVDGGRYHGWAETGQTTFDDCLRKEGITLYWHDLDGGLTLDHIKPKFRGVKDVYIERELRNSCYLRMYPELEHTDKLFEISKDAKTMEKNNLLLLAWSPKKRRDANIQHDSLKHIWTERVKSANSLAGRKTARWTNKEQFCCMNCCHKHMMNHAANAKLGATIKSADFLLLDTSPGKDQKPERLLQRLIALLNLSDKVEAKRDKTTMLLQKDVAPWFRMGRRMFREDLHYKSI